MIKDEIKILILEDNPDDLELILLELDKADFDYSYEHASDGDAFEAYLKYYRPDIILSDYNIPGYDIFKAMDALESYSIDSPFILNTGALGDERAVDLIVNLGVSDYILKDNLARLNPAIQREYKNSIAQKNLSSYEEEIEKLSLVASHTHNGVIISDGDGKVEWVNEGYTKITGYTLQDTVGKKPGDLLQGPKTNPDTVKRIGEKLAAEISFTEEILNYTKSGDTYWIKLNITPVKNDTGKVEKFIAIQEDITERKEAELALEKSFSTLQKAQKIGKIGNWSFDVKSGEVFWSKQLYQIYERDEKLGPPSFEEVKRTAQREGSDDTLKLIQDALEYGKPYDVEVKLDTENPKYIRAIGQAIKNDSGDIIGLEGTVQDITEPKRAQQELLRTSKQLTDISDNINGVLLQYELTPGGGYQLKYISNQAEEFFGIPKEEILDNDALIWEKVPESDHKELLSNIDASRKSMEPWNYTYRYLKPNGDLKFFQGQGTPSKQEDGTILWNTVTIDVTKNKLAEEELLKTSKQLDDIINGVEGVFQRYAIYPDGTDSVLYMSDGVEDLFGIPKEKVLQNTAIIWDTVHEDDREAFKKTLEYSANNLTTLSHTKRHHVGDGKIKYLQVFGTPARQEDGTVIWNTITIDVTEKATAEQNQNQLQELLNTTLNEVYIVDAETLNIVYCNEAAIINTGYEREELLQLTSLDLLKQSNEDQNAKILNDIPASGKHSIKTTHTRKDGSTYPVLTQLSKATYKDKSVYIANVLDITELTQKERELEKALDEKDTLIQEINHRVKNNLAIISGLIELQIMRGNTQPELVDTKTRIHTIAAVHEQLYNTSSFSEVKVDKYFSSLISNSKSTFVTDDQDIKVNFNSTIDEININDAVPIGLLINELITNSVKHAFNGEAGFINIDIESVKDSRIHFSYSDSGRGFDKDMLESHPKNGHGFGLELIKTLLSQLTEEYALVTENKFSLQFEFERKKRGPYSNL
jgi:PAS domain S-box-containing protein